MLRRAAVACLRQLVTREAKEVSDQALTLAVDSNKPDPSYMARPESNITETGLEGVLYGMMDTEIDGKLISDIEDTLVSLLQSLATKNLTRWLLLLKDVLSASTGKCYIGHAGKCYTGHFGKCYTDQACQPCKCCDTLVSLLQSLATKNLTRWLLLLKDVLSASTGKCYIGHAGKCYTGHPGQSAAVSGHQESDQVAIAAEGRSQCLYW